MACELRWITIAFDENLLHLTVVSTRFASKFSSKITPSSTLDEVNNCRFVEVGVDVRISFLGGIIHVLETSSRIKLLYTYLGYNANLLFQTKVNSQSHGDSVNVL